MKIALDADIEVEDARFAADNRPSRLIDIREFTPRRHYIPDIGGGNEALPGAVQLGRL